MTQSNTLMASRMRRKFHVRFRAGENPEITSKDYLSLLEESEFELIRYPQQGVCLYKCGNERYLLEVKAPPHKAELFGKAGGR